MSFKNSRFVIQIIVNFWVNHLIGYKSKTGLVRLTKFLMLAWCQEHHKLKTVFRFSVSLPDHSVWIFKVSLKNLNVRSFVGLPFQYIDRILLN